MFGGDDVEFIVDDYVIKNVGNFEGEFKTANSAVVDRDKIF